MAQKMSTKPQTEIPGKLLKRQTERLQTKSQIFSKIFKNIFKKTKNGNFGVVCERGGERRRRPHRPRRLTGEALLRPLFATVRS